MLVKKIYELRGLVVGPEDYVFANILTRQRQGPYDSNKKFTQMKEDLGYGSEYALYSTQSVYISDRIVQGSPLSLSAQNWGNSTRVIKENYQHIILKVNAEPLLKRNAKDGAVGEFVFWPIQLICLLSQISE